MTIDEAKKSLIAWCESQIGTHEGANNWTPYAENMDLQRWYGWIPQNQPWCDIFADSAYLNSFGLNKAAAMTYQPIGQGSALCSASANRYKSNCAWYGKPEVGDQIFYYSNGDINHTGIVVEVNGNYVTAIEGNSSDTVKRNTYPQTSGYIAGYGRPNWSVVADDTQESNAELIVDEKPKVEPKLKTITIALPAVQYGNKGLYVKVMQTALIEKGYPCGWMGADGEYGEKTRKALTRFQRENGLTEDGICGVQTWIKLLKAG